MVCQEVPEIISMNIQKVKHLKTQHCLGEDTGKTKGD